MKYLIICTVLTLCCLVSFGQNKSDLKGPAAKNYKPWQDKSIGSPLVTQGEVNKFSGPEAKNVKVWEKSNKNMIAVKAVANKPKGYKAKNSKVWKD